MKRGYVLVVLVILSLFILAGCSSKSSIYTSRQPDNQTEKKNDSANRRISPVEKFELIAR